MYICLYAFCVCVHMMYICIHYVYVYAVSILCIFYEYIILGNPRPGKTDLSMGPGTHMLRCQH